MTERLVAMREKLRNEAGRGIFAKRDRTVEPVIGAIKAPMALRQFLLRGLEKVKTEWDMVCLAYHMKRLFNLATT